MTTILLIIHIVLALAIIGLVLLQRGTGGGLGLGESGGLGGFATPRSAANILTKATTWCALLFFGTSLSLAIIASHNGKSGVLEELKSQPATAETAPGVPATTGADTIAPAVPVPAAAKAPEAPVNKVPEAPATP